MLPASKRLPLPPFGRVIQAYLEENVYKIPQIDIYIGSQGKAKAYREKKWGELCCYLPYGDSYLAYKWPVQDQNIMILDMGGITSDFIIMMASHLFVECGAHAISANPGNRILYFNKEFQK
jgi:hypothetical protein